MTKLSDSDTLRPFLRNGLDSGCVMCNRPVAAHVDHRGYWIGCPSLTDNVPMILIPDRRSPQQDTAADTAHHYEPPPPTRPTPRQDRQTERRAPQQHRQAPARRFLPTGPQVLYLARYAVSTPQIDRLPPHDRKVYGLIARMRGKGATRALLLDALDATKATGRVDGAIRRLRLRKVISVRSITE